MFCRWVLYISNEFLNSCLRNLIVVPEKNHPKRKPNYAESNRGHTCSALARLLWAHLRFLGVILIQKSLDTGPIVRMDITEVLDLKIDINITLAALGQSKHLFQCLLERRKDTSSGSRTTQWLTTKSKTGVKALT